MDKPGIDLVKEHFVADKENARKHVLDYWISAYTSLVNGVEKFPSP